MVVRAVSVLFCLENNLSSGCRYSTCKDYRKGASRVSSKDNSGIHTRIHRSPIFQNSWETKVCAITREPEPTNCSYEYIRRSKKDYSTYVHTYCTLYEYLNKKRGLTCYTEWEPRAIVFPGYLCHPSRPSQIAVTTLGLFLFVEQHIQDCRNHSFYLIINNLRTIHNGFPQGFERRQGSKPCWGCVSFIIVRGVGVILGVFFFSMNAIGGTPRRISRRSHTRSKESASGGTPLQFSNNLSHPFSLFLCIF